jgi:multimeric flavodoxin WrbA
VESFLKGASAAGADVENIFLAKKKIGRCLGCFSCWIKTPGECVIKDDMKELLHKHIVSDIVIFATPLYVDNVSGIMKNFMDRSIPLADPHFEKDPSGQARHVSRIKRSVNIGVIANAGFPEQDQFQVLKLLFKRIARAGHAELVAEIYKGEGELLKSTDKEMAPVIAKYKESLVKAGGELVKNLMLSRETIEELEKPLIPYEDYVKAVNQGWDEELKKPGEIQKPSNK